MCSVNCVPLPNFVDLNIYSRCGSFPLFLDSPLKLSKKKIQLKVKE